MPYTDDAIDLEAMERESEGLPKETKAESPVKAFRIDTTDSRGRRWKGDFVFHCPNLGEQVKIGRLKAGLLPQGAYADPNAGLIAEMMGYLQITLKVKPSWWKPETFHDAHVLSTVYGEARAYEARFLGGDSDAQGDGGSAVDRPRADDQDDVE